MLLVWRLFVWPAYPQANRVVWIRFLWTFGVLILTGELTWDFVSLGTILFIILNDAALLYRGYQITGEKSTRLLAKCIA